MNGLEAHIQISHEVSSSLKTGWPVVALESTVIAHGLPHPVNVETALELEDTIRKSRAIPATIAVLDGVIRVGLTKEEIERLAGDRDNILKLGARDLPAALAAKKDGATTVSATSFIASKVGIEVFVTGGMGGVHHGASRTLDISSDLWELAHSGVIVVCAGAKAILDLPATLEWLETHQVPVFGYGTEEFPGFYSRKTGLWIERVDTPEEVADRFLIQRDIGMRSGMVVGVPIPAEHELRVGDPISEALVEAERRNIKGKDVTPWVLAHLSEMTAGKTVASNIALLKNNAAVGAEIAKALAFRRQIEKGAREIV